MALLFGEFLIDRNLVQADQVLEALIEQLRAVPSTAELLYDRGLMPRPAILRILAHQQYNGMDFRGSAHVLGLWTEEVSTRVNAALQGIRRPLGEILVSKGFLNLAALAAALDAYIETSGRPSDAAQLAAASAPAARTSVGFSAAGAAVSAGLLDSSLAKEYTDAFEVANAPAIAVAIAALMAAGDDYLLLQAAMRKALAEFVALRAAAGFLGASHSEAVANAVVAMIERISPTSLSPGARGETEVVKLALHILDGVVQYLKDFTTEALVATDPNMKDLIERFWKAIERVHGSRPDAAA